MNRYHFILIFIFVLTACSAKIKKQIAKEYPYDVIEVTANGGFAGTTTGFAIQKNAEINLIYHLPGKSYQQKFFRLSTEDSVRMIFDKVWESGIYDDEFKKSGNMTYSITFRKDTSFKSIYWTDGLDSTAKYIEMYRLLRGFATGKNK